jgi:hypothetical protein
VDPVLQLAASTFGKCCYLTNATFVPPSITQSPMRISQFSRLTAHTFDSGVAFVSESRIGLIWVWDED